MTDDDRMFAIEQAVASFGASGCVDDDTLMERVEVIFNLMACPQPVHEPEVTK